MSSETKWVMCGRHPRCKRRASVGYSDLPALTAGLGFASSNISDVTLARASRVTPAVTSAQAALEDAMAARDRECKGGLGKFCREREAAVAILLALLPQIGGLLMVVGLSSARSVKADRP
jgi:hypothetical protein